MSQEQVTQLNYAQPPQQYGAREGFLLRFCAGLIDGVFSLVPYLIGLALARFVNPWVGAIFTSLVCLAYSTLEIFKAATPGKMLLKLKITNEDGSDASQPTLIKRWAIKQIPQFFNLLAVVTTLALLGYLTLFCFIGYVISCCLTFRPERQALHDTMAHTAVSRTQTAVAAAIPTPAQQPQKQAA